MDKEKEIEEMAKVIFDYADAGAFQQIPYSILSRKQAKMKRIDEKDTHNYAIAETLYKAGYRKMDEVTLRLDLGDRSAEEIKQIAEAFNGDIKKQAVKEFAENIIELLDEMGMERSSEYNDGYDDGVGDCITNIKSRSTELYGAD